MRESTGQGPIDPDDPWADDFLLDPSLEDFLFEQRPVASPEFRGALHDRIVIELARPHRSRSSRGHDAGRARQRGPLGRRAKAQLSAAVGYACCGLALIVLPTVGTIGLGPLAP